MQRTGQQRPGRTPRSCRSRSSDIRTRPARYSELGWCCLANCVRLSGWRCCEPSVDGKAAYASAFRILTSKPRRSNFAWVRATQGGLFQRAVHCGERLKVGTVLGHYYDLWGQPTGEALSPNTGVVLAIHPGPLMASGETLVHIGLDPREV